MRAFRSASGRRVIGVAWVVGILLLGIAALGALPVPRAAAQGGTVEVWILGIEFKGTAGSGEPYVEQGSVVERYVFYPDTVRVQKGDQVILNFFGINGGSGHPVTIEYYVPESFTFYRNQTVTKEFIADRAGVFEISCAVHQPTMVGQLVVEDVPAVQVDPLSLGLLIVQGGLLAATVVLLRRRLRPT